MFMNHWAKLSEMNVDDYVPTPEEVREILNPKAVETEQSELDEVYF